MYDEAQYLKADGFDDAIVGTAHGMTVDEDGGPILVYDIEKCVDIIMDGAVDMEREEAYEYFTFNVMGAFHGPQTPIFLDRAVLDYQKLWDKDKREDIYLDHLEV